MAFATVELEDGHVAGGAEDIEDQKDAADGDVDAGDGRKAELGCETGVGSPVLNVLDSYVHSGGAELGLSYLGYGCSVHVVCCM